jgi:hypothetical protein
LEIEGGVISALFFQQRESALGVIIVVLRQIRPMIIRLEVNAGYSGG